MPEKIKKNPKDVEQNKMLAALSYIWVISIVMYFLKKDSPFVQFHAKQGIALFILEVLSVLFGPFAIFVIILAVVLAIKGVKACLEGKYWVMPVIGDWIRQKEL